MIQGNTARQTSGGFKALLPMAIFFAPGSLELIPYRQDTR